MLRRTFFIAVLMVSLSVLIETQQHKTARNQSGSRPKPTNHGAKEKAPKKPVTTFIHDTGGRELIVRILDVGQGDAVYIRNGNSRIIVDGGPDPVRFGRYLDSLRINNSTIDVVILSHQHLDHYSGLRELFNSSRHIHVRYFFENKDPASTGTLRQLRDSILSRMDRDSLIYRDTDDPCVDGRRMCTITLTGGARLHILAPDPRGDKANNRSVALKLVGPDSASFSMWMAGDAEHEEIAWFARAGYDQNPGMRAHVLKADHHGSCNGVTRKYLAAIQPLWVVASVGAVNGYGHMHTQAKRIYRSTRVPWLRTDENGSVTIRSPGTPGGHFTITSDHPGISLDGAADRRSRQEGC